MLERKSKAGEFQSDDAETLDKKVGGGSIFPDVSFVR